jgi:hypothetical protein
VLRACRRILVLGGRTAFFTIFVSPGLSRRDHRRAVRLGPRAVASSRAQSELVAAAGFVEVDEIDFTEEFLETARRWLRYSREFEPALRESLGNDVVDEQLAARTDMVTAIEEGLLKRSLLLAGTAGSGRARKRRTTPGQ